MDRPLLHMLSSISSLNIHFNTESKPVQVINTVKGSLAVQGDLVTSERLTWNLVECSDTQQACVEPGNLVRGWAGLGFEKTKSMSAKAHETMRSSTIIIPLKVGSSKCVRTQRKKKFLISYEDQERELHKRKKRRKAFTSLAEILTWQPFSSVFGQFTSSLRASPL